MYGEHLTSLFLNYSWYHFSELYNKESMCKQTIQKHTGH